MTGGLVAAQRSLLSEAGNGAESFTATDADSANPMT
jgi:hypothetical protein